MAKKFSELPAGAAPADADLLAASQSGSTVKWTIAQIKTMIDGMIGYALGLLGTASAYDVGTAADELPTNADLAAALAPKWDLLVQPVITAGALDIDLIAPAGFLVDLDQDVTDLTFSGAPAGRYTVFAITFVQDATGGREITWPAAIVGAPAQPDPAPDAVTIMSFATWDAGTTVHAAV